jgi:hypothetical protein
MPRRHASPDARHAGADAGAVAGADLRADDAPALARADDAGAVAVADAPADLLSDDPWALRLSKSGAYASANTNTDAGALRHSDAPADARAVRKSDALTHGLAPAHAAADAQTYSETHPNADAAPYTYADHAAAVARADAEADASPDADADAAADHVAALARTVAEANTSPDVSALPGPNTTAIPLAHRTSRRPHDQPCLRADADAVSDADAAPLAATDARAHATAAYPTTVAAADGRRADARAVADPLRRDGRALVLRREPGGSSRSRGRLRGRGGNPVRRWWKCGDRDDLGRGKKASGWGFAPGALPGADTPQERLRTNREADDVAADAAAD